MEFSELVVSAYSPSGDSTRLQKLHCVTSISLLHKITQNYREVNNYTNFMKKRREKNMDMDIRELSGCDLPNNFWPPDDLPECGVPEVVVKRIAAKSGVKDKHVRAVLLYAKHCNFDVVGSLMGKAGSTISNWVSESSTRLHKWAEKEIIFSKKKILSE